MGKQTDSTDPQAVRLVEIKERLGVIDAELLGLAEVPVFDEAQQLRWDELSAERDILEPQFEKLEERAARVADIRSKSHRFIAGLPEPKRPAAEYFGRDVRGMTFQDARDGALRSLDDREANFVLAGSQKERIEKLVRSGSHTDLARRIIVTENDAYRSAFHKMMTYGSNIVLEDDEMLAMRRYQEYRAQSEGTTTAGGFAVPVFIDPSVILTDQETDNPFLTLARQVNVTTNAWKGISAAGMSWSFDAEGAAVSDDSVSLAQPSVTIFTARGFIPYSIEIGEDWPGFQAEMGRLLSEGYDELLLQKFTNGNGTTEPRGLLTALAANTNVQVVSTTDGAFGAEDLYKVWSALPQKYRRRANWMGSVGVNNKIRQFGNGNNFGNATVNLAAGAANEVMGKNYYENPYMPDFTGTTGVENRLVTGDFSNYVIARRTGMNVEFVPQLFDVTNNRPTGQRGWFAYARIGGNSVNDLGFRLLLNT